MTTENEICCPKFDPTPWQDQKVSWTEKLFIKETMTQIMHMPIPGVFGKTVVKMSNKIEEAGAKTDDKDFLMLCHDLSPWKNEMYICVTKEVPGVENAKISGTFLTKVFDGPYKNVPKWIKEMEGYVEGKGKKIKDFYFYYTTCPKCAKKYGHNYVVVFAQI